MGTYRPVLTGNNAVHGVANDEGVVDRRHIDCLARRSVHKWMENLATGELRTAR